MDRTERVRRVAFARYASLAYVWAYAGAYVGMLVLCAPALAIPPNTPITNTAMVDYVVGGTPYNNFASAIVIASGGNSPPASVVLDPADVDENVSGGVVGTLTTVDPDPADTHSYSVGDPRFEVVGDVLRLIATASLDFEAVNSVLLSVTADDGNGGTLTSSFTVNVNDLNEPATAILLSGTTFAGAQAGAVVGNLAATDPDAGDVHAYAVDDVRFEVVAGQLKLLDTEFLPSGTGVSLVITATDSGGLAYSQPFTVTAVGASSASILEFFGAGVGATVDVSSTQCSASGAPAGPFQAISGPASLGVAPRSLFKVGEGLVVQVTDADANTDAGVVDNVMVTLTFSTGDVELLQLGETNVDTGLFIGYLPSNGGATNPNDCLAQVAFDATVTGTYTDANDPSDTSTANALVDPHGLIFDSGSGQPIDGATVTLIDAGTGSPASVFGDSVASFPSTVISGGSVVDGAGISYNFAAGRYRFPLVAPGDYRLEVVAPNRFTFPSAALDSALQTLPGAPFSLGPGSRGGAFTVPVGPAFRVDIALDLQPITPTDAELALFVASPGNPGAQSTYVSDTECLVGASFVMAPSSVALPANFDLVPTTRFRRGEPIFIRLTDPDQDRDPFAADRVSIRFETDAGDQEIVGLSETGASTGVFTGFVPTDLTGVSASDCALSALAGQTFTASYQDIFDTGDMVAAAGVLDPGMTVFDSLTGGAVSGTQLSLVDDTSGATVAGPIASDSAGDLLLPAVAAGRYRLVVEPPLSFEFPSAVSDADLNALAAGPFQLTAASRGVAFDVFAGLPISFDVPLDAISADILVSKQASKDVASVGDFLQYQVLVQNSHPSGTVTAVTIHDQLPKGFRYVPGSTRVDGAQAADPVIGSAGRALQFTGHQIGPQESVEISYVVEITVGSEQGTALNRASVSGIGVGNSNEAVAGVIVREDLLASKATLVGEVFDGCDGAAETGVAGVRVYLEDGTYVVTDAEGKYHFEGVEAGTHVVQLDVASIPSTHEISPCATNSRFAGTPYSQFVDVNGGTLWRADFHLARKAPLQGQVSSRLSATRDGSDIQYRYVLTGVGEVPLRELTTLVMLPDSVTYQPGSALLNGARLADPEGVDTGTLAFRLGDADGAFDHELAFLVTDPGTGGTLEAKAVTLLKTDGGRARTPPVTNTLSAAEPSRTIEIRLQFAQAGKRLDAAAKAQLREVVRGLRDVKGVYVEAVGHADSVPISKRLSHRFADNQALSRARAESVAAFMQNVLDVDPSHIRIEARGAAEPIASNDTKKGRAANRRVELQIVEPGVEPGVNHVLSDVAVVEVTAEQRLQPRPGVHIPDVPDGKAPEFDNAWLATRAMGRQIAWPEAFYNPRIPSIGVAVTHPFGERVTVLANGKLVNPLSFDGTRTDRARGLAVTRYRNVHLDPGDNLIEVRIVDAEGRLLASLDRSVHFSGAPVRAEIVPERSYLVADGITPVVVAVRLYDRGGYPARPGITGSFRLVSAHSVYREIGLIDDLLVQPADEKYVVRDDGIAYVRLDATTATDDVRLSFEFGEHLLEELEAHLTPAARDWILVGLGEGTLGYKSLSGNMQALSEAGQQAHVSFDGRLAFYAKGRIKGEWLATLAYDTDKSRDRRIFQQIDPNRFYTLYGDGTNQAYDAESQSKLYLKLERDTFQALFGDFETGLDETELTRYSRALTGVKTRLAGTRWDLTGFAALTDMGYVRDEIRGDGTSGIYRLSRRALVRNSDKISLETRDRFQSEIIVSVQALRRFVDYSIDYDAGTVIFKQPVASQDMAFNPVYIVAEYETVGLDAGDDLVAGGRVGYRFGPARSPARGEVALTYINDGTGTQPGELAGVDLRWQMSPDTTLTAEAAATNAAPGDAAGAYLVEIRHQTPDAGGRVYIKDQQADFGLGQQNASEAGMRKIGVDGSLRLTDRITWQSEAYQQINVIADAERQLVETGLEFRDGRFAASGSVRSVRERFADASDVRSNQLTAGISQGLAGGRARVRAYTEADVGGQGATDYPTRAVLGAEYDLVDGVSLVAEQELTWSQLRDTQDTRIGIKARPWSGTDVNATVERKMTENGERVFATTGLLQQWRIDDRWSADLGLDRVHTVTRSDRPVVNPLVPPASGSIDDDFTAVFAGLGYRRDSWDANSRIEFHQGDKTDKWNLLAGLTRQLSDGKAVSGSLTWRLEDSVIAERRRGDLRIGVAWRPAGTRWMFLNRLDFTLDELVDPLFDTRSQKLVNNFNANFQPRAGDQLSLQLGVKYVVDNIDGEHYKGLTALYGFEYRKSLRPRWDLGLSGSVRHSVSSRVFRYAIGASAGHHLAHNLWVSAGYNIVGFEDEDFSAGNYTAQGPYVTFRMKVDQDAVRELVNRGVRPWKRGGQ
ncbi:MAG: OmpA family protein [Gammaproteobacteria bacterium]|nr:OmpA family protein [Gammaproteobacteria bacterium]